MRLGFSLIHSRTALAACVPAAVLAVGVGLTATTASASASGCGDLRIGAYGPCVAKLQAALEKSSADSNFNNDQYFGPYTKSEVEEFQRENGLEPDGVVGAQTWTALGVTKAAPAHRTPTPAAKAKAAAQVKAAEKRAATEAANAAKAAAQAKINTRNAQIAKQSAAERRAAAEATRVAKAKAATRAKAAAQVKAAEKRAATEAANAAQAKAATRAKAAAQVKAAEKRAATEAANAAKAAAQAKINTRNAQIAKQSAAEKRAATEATRVAKAKAAARAKAAAQVKAAEKRAATEAGAKRKAAAQAKANTQKVTKFCMSGNLKVARMTFTVKKSANRTRITAVEVREIKPALAGKGTNASTVSVYVPGDNTGDLFTSHNGITRKSLKGKEVTGKASVSGTLYNSRANKGCTLNTTV